MALSAEVQALVDEVSRNTSVEASATLALTQLVSQITDLNNQIAALGQGMSAEDLAAVKTATQALSDTAVALEAAVPANTKPPEPPVEPPVA